MKQFLNSAIGLLALCSALLANATTPLKEMAEGGAVYGYQDPANCVTWSKHAKYLNMPMYYTTTPPSAYQAKDILVGKTIDGVTNWRLPTLDEFRSFYDAVGSKGMTSGSFQAIDSNGVVVSRLFDVGSPALVQYWSSEEEGAIVYGFVATTGGIMPHSYSGGAKLYVWAVRSADGVCGPALVSPFVSPSK